MLPPAAFGWAKSCGGLLSCRRIPARLSTPSSAAGCLGEVRCSGAERPSTVATAGFELPINSVGANAAMTASNFLLINGLFLASGKDSRLRSKQTEGGALYWWAGGRPLGGRRAASCPSAEQPGVVSRFPGESGTTPGKTGNGGGRSEVAPRSLSAFRHAQPRLPAWSVQPVPFPIDAPSLAVESPDKDLRRPSHGEDPHHGV
jgi:hypothetical protein